VPPSSRPARPAEGDWWRTAVVYQVYPRSFADSDGDGVGDLPGVTAHLDALAALGVAALWLCPFYPSPQVDAGYDVADYCDVDPVFGSLADLDALLEHAHALGLRVLVDLVPNHTSSEHPWFQAALAAGPGSPERSRYVFRDEPTDWGSVFGGSAWTQVPDGQWYLHLFDPAQPDLDWADPQVADDFDAILRFWLDRGVDGFRVDVAHGLVVDRTFPSYAEPPLSLAAKQGAPYWDQEGVHEVYRRWRRLLDEQSRTDPAHARILTGEVNLPVARAVRYARHDEFHQVFNFPYLTAAWSAPLLRALIDETLAAYGAVGAAATWVLANHDVRRVVTRLGPRPARAAALLILALPGSAYVYQGDELGLPDHTTLPDDQRRDPTFRRTGGAEPGRDGARIPLPWRADAPNLGFGDGRPWLPQPTSYAALARDRQRDDPSSMLALYTEALRLRRELRLGAGELVWRSEPDADVLAFERGPVRVTTNAGTTGVELPADAEVLLSSDPRAGRTVPPDTTVWWR
jgi:alpha-glucosidase